MNCVYFDVGPISISLFELILIFSKLTEYYLQELYTGGSQFDTRAGFRIPRWRRLVSSVCPASTVIADHNPCRPHLYLLASHPTFHNFHSKNTIFPEDTSQTLVLPSKQGDSLWNGVQGGLLFEAGCSTIHNRCESDMWMTVHRNSVWKRKTN